MEHDFFGGGGGDLMGGAVPTPVEPPKPQLVAPDNNGWGIKTDGIFSRENGQVLMKCDFTNVSLPTPTSQIAVQLNKSSFGIFPVQAQVNFNPPLSQGSKQTHNIPMTINPNHVAPGAPNLNVQAALKNMQTGTVVYCQATMTFPVLFGEDGMLEKGVFLNLWKGIDESKEVYSTVMDLPTVNIDAISQKFARNNIFHIAKRSVPDNTEVAYYSIKTVTGLVILLELTFKQGVNGCKVCVKTEQPPIAPLTQQCVEQILKSA